MEVLYGAWNSIWRKVAAAWVGGCVLLCLLVLSTLCCRRDGVGWMETACCSAMAFRTRMRIQLVDASVLLYFLSTILDGQALLPLQQRDPAAHGSSRSDDTDVQPPSSLGHRRRRRTSRLRFQSYRRGGSKDVTCDHGVKKLRRRERLAARGRAMLRCTCAYSIETLSARRFVS